MRGLPLLVLLVLPSILFAAVLGFGIAELNTLVLVGLVGTSVAVATFLDLRITLFFIVPAMVILPELPFGLPIRTEDLLMVPLTVAWLILLAVGRVRVPQTPMNRVLFALIFVEAVATLLGAMQGSAGFSVQLYGGTFFLLKTIEVTFLFLITISVIEDERDLRLFTLLFLASGAVLGGWGILQRGEVGEGAGVYGPEGETGYSLLGLTYVVLLAASAGLVLVLKKGRQRTTFLALALPVALALPFTLSRQSYVGAVVAFMVLVWVWDRRLIVPLILASTVVPFVAPSVVQERFVSMLPGQVDPRFGTNPYATRANALRSRVPEVLTESPFLGFGLAAIPPGFLDNQYLLTLYYTGLIGLAVFIWVLVRAGRVSFRLMNRVRDGPTRGLALGWMAATLGLALAGLAGNPFVAIRVRQSYWFLAALALAGAKVAARRARENGAPEPAPDQAPPPKAVRGPARRRGRHPGPFRPS